MVGAKKIAAGVLCFLVALCLGVVPTLGIGFAEFIAELLAESRLLARARSAAIILLAIGGTGLLLWGASEFLLADELGLR